MKPDCNDVAKEVENVLKDHPDLCQSIQVGQSVQGRELPGVTVTDPEKGNDDKQQVLVIAGQHGSEESGRAIALELLNWLTSDDPAAVETRRNQMVTVLPCVNPDGSLADTYRNADDIDIAHTYSLERAAGTPEGRAVEALAQELIPDVFVDIHGLAGGSMKDRIWLSRPLGFTPDRYFQTMICEAMTAAAEAAGFPQCEPVPPAPFEGETYSLGEKLGAELKALTFGIESIESYYREEEWRADGLAKLKALLAFGNQDAFGLGESGYPSSLISGSRICGLKAHGVNTAERRTSRAALIEFLRRNFAMVDRQSDGVEGACRVKVMSETMAGPNPDRFSIMLRFKTPCKIRSIQWEETALKPDPDHGYRLREDANSYILQVNLKTPFGGPERWLTVEYESPFLT
ncbi:M14 family zinc carboxypeptidase [Planctomycetota bacterium]